MGKSEKMLDGLLLLDKPEGIRSTDCVNKLNRLLKIAGAIKGQRGEKTRAGHAGTLDSTASGLLVLLIGRATRLSDYIMMLPKVYRATLRLGQMTDTCDYSGQVISQGDTAQLTSLTSGDIDKILPAFYGWQMQLPPEISAVKLNGRPAHKLARAGENVNLVPRPVFLRSIKRISPVTVTQEHVAHVELEISCSKGTYIRSLARDIGEALGCGACIESLRRVSIGKFHVNKASPLEVLDVTRATSQEDLQIKQILHDMREIVPHFNRIALTPDAEERIIHGMTVPLVKAGCFASGCVPMAKLEPSHSLCLEGRNMIGFADIVTLDDLDNKAIAKSQELLLKPRVNILVD